MNFLRGAGYEFEWMDGLCGVLEIEHLPDYDIDKVIR